MDKDTLSLLRECTAGIELAMATMEGVLPNVRDPLLRRKLLDGSRTREDLQEQSAGLLRQWGCEEKHPSAMAKQLALLRSSTRLALKRDDPTAAEVIAHSCDQTIRALCRSRNRYVGADHTARFLAEQLIACEENLSAGLRSFL